MPLLPLIFFYGCRFTYLFEAFDLQATIRKLEDNGNRPEHLHSKKILGSLAFSPRI